MIKKLINDFGFEKTLEIVSESVNTINDPLLYNDNIDQHMKALEDNKKITFQQTLELYKVICPRLNSVDQSRTSDEILEIFSITKNYYQLIYNICRQIFIQGKSDWAEKYHIPDSNTISILYTNEDKNRSRDNFNAAFPNQSPLAKKWYNLCRTTTGIIPRFHDTFNSADLVEMYPYYRDDVINNLDQSNICDELVYSVVDNIDCELLEKIMLFEPKELGSVSTSIFSTVFNIKRKRIERKEVEIPMYRDMINLIYKYRHQGYGTILYENFTDKHKLLLEDEYLAEVCNVSVPQPETDEDIERIILIAKQIPDFEKIWKIMFAYHLCFEKNISIYSAPVHVKYTLQPILNKEPGFCSICFEHCDYKISCGHNYHLSCYIKSNLHKCSLCLKPVLHKVTK